MRMVNAKRDIIFEFCYFSQLLLFVLVIRKSEIMPKVVRVFSGSYEMFSLETLEVRVSKRLYTVIWFLIYKGAKRAFYHVLRK